MSMSSTTSTDSSILLPKDIYILLENLVIVNIKIILLKDNISLNIFFQQFLLVYNFF